MDVRFRGKSGHAADIIGTTEFDPEADIGPLGKASIQSNSGPPQRLASLSAAG
jgi:hypothetical protein